MKINLKLLKHFALNEVNLFSELRDSLQERTRNRDDNVC